MIEFKHILCPIDFSETSIRALKYATALAHWYESQLDVLHVVPAFESVPMSHVAAVGGVGRVLHATRCEEIVKDIRSAIDEAGTGDTHHRALALEGRVHEMIVSHAAAQPADLIVLGTHGRGGFNRLFLGSVTEKVVRTAPCAVLTVPPGAPATNREPISFKRILCAIDFSPASLAALKYALELGRQANGCVTVLHALEYMDPEEPCEHVDAATRKARSLRIDHARQRLHHQLADEPTTSCAIEEVVVPVNRAYREILQRAASAHSDLIVMGAQGSSGIELMLYGSNTQHVVRAATCPVLTVRG